MLIGMQNAMEAGTIADVVGPERTIGCVIELSSEMFTPGLVKRNTPPQKTWIGLGALEGDPGARLAEMQALLSRSARSRSSRISWRRSGRSSSSTPCASAPSPWWA